MRLRVQEKDKSFAINALSFFPFRHFHPQRPRIRRRAEARARDFYDRTKPTFPYFSYLRTGKTYLYASAYQGFTPENLRNTPKTEL